MRWPAALLLGVIEALGMHFTNPSLKALLSYVVFIGVLLLRPEGLFAKKTRKSMNSRQILIRDLLVLFGLTGWAVALPGFASEFVTSMALTCLMYVALSSSWALFCGTTRYLSLATSAFFGIGAYTSALSLEHMPWAQAVMLGALIAGGGGGDHGRGGGCTCAAPTSRC